MKRLSIVFVLLAMSGASAEIQPKQSSLTGQATTESNAGEQIKWQVISSGGLRGTSTNYVLNGTVGQTAVGVGSSTSYGLRHGFWQNLGAGGCCTGTRGNANNDPLDKANVADVTYLLAWLFGIPSGPAPVCMEEANVNADLTPGGGQKVNVSDVTYMLAWLFGIPSGPAPKACP